MPIVHLVVDQLVPWKTLVYYTGTCVCVSVCATQQQCVLDMTPRSQNLRGNTLQYVFSSM